MTRDEIYEKCVEEIAKTNCLLLQLPTGYGKTAISLKLCIFLFVGSLNEMQEVNVVILVAKRVQ